MTFGNKKMNERFIQSNVKEAHEELSGLLQLLASGIPLDFETYHAALAHAYHHLNLAWNGRNMSDKDWKEYTDKMAVVLKALPTDLPFIGDDGFWGLPEYKQISGNDDT